MSLAIDSISTAIEHTKKLLLPFDFKKWLWIALIIFLVGQGGASVPNFSGAENLPGLIPDDIDVGFWALIGAIFALFALTLGLLFHYLRSMFTFVLYDTIKKSKVHIRKSFNEYHAEGIGVFWFGIILGLVSLAIVGVCGLIVWASWDSFDPGIVIGVILGILILIAVTLFNWFVSTVAIPQMYFKRLTIMNAIRRAFKLLKQNTGDVLLFFVMQVVLGIAVAMIMIPILVVAFLIVAIIGGIFFGTGWLLYSLSASLMWPLIVVGVLIGLLLLILLIGLVTLAGVPFATFTNAYVLEVNRQLK